MKKGVILEKYQNYFATLGRQSGAKLSGRLRLLGVSDVKPVFDAGTPRPPVGGLRQTAGGTPGQTVLHQPDRAASACPN